MGMSIGCVAEKVRQLVLQEGGPISVKELTERLTEPIGLIHLGISQLVREGKVGVVTRARRNYIINSAPVVLPQVVESEHLAAT
jgi:hypothetical protein